jgi:GTP-binding protein
LVRAFLRGRSPLRRLCLLIDARHGFKDSDRALMDMLDEAAVNYLIVLTKCDKYSTAQLAAREAAIAEETRRRAAAHPDVIATSAMRDIGIARLRAHLAALAEAE